MSDTLLNVYQVMAARPAEHVVGWRRGQAVQNAAFLKRVSDWRALLSRLNGKNFALYYDDSIEFAAALFGAWYAGKTIWLTADTLDLNCRSLQRSVDGFLGEFPTEFTPLVPSADDENCDAYPALCNDFKALVVHTSGTTGVAQAIPKCLAQLSREVATLETMFGSKLTDAVIIATVSHHHIYGLLFKVLWPLMAGRAIHAQSQNFPEELAQLLAGGSCALISSPAHLKRLPDHLDWSSAAGRLRAVFSSGGPLEADVARNIGICLGQIPIEVYGSSETGGIAWRQRTADADESWQPLPHVEWRIANEENLLEVRSPHLADDCWLRLADRVQENLNGRFLLNGRSDRIVKIEEKRISLDVIERQLMTSPLVLAARILLCDQLPGQRQRLAAFIVTSDQGRHLLETEGKASMNRHLIESLTGAIEPIAFPRRWRYLDQMPVNSQGKTPQALLLGLLETRPRLPHVCVLERDDQRVLLKLIAPENLFYFDGHFSEAPVLPGVVQIDWAMQYGRDYFNLPKHFRAIHSLKFQHVIRPDSPVSLELNYDLQKGCLNFRFFSTEQHSSGRILFAIEAREESI